ncbi:MAG: hypothetical protein JWL59_3540, partial [Chthoniobacteraceae bacterium]|nr:hypothetical protein [Chthoniobacteraceae bacterium]
MSRHPFSGRLPLSSIASILASLTASQAHAAETTPVERPIYIKEYRVAGARHLPKIAVEEAVYPFLGPGRTSIDVEQARAALEQAYKEKGFQTVTVEV